MKNTIKDINQKSVKELEKEAQSIRVELAKGRLDWTSNSPKDTNVLSKKKKRLAQVLTVLTEKKELENLKK